MKTEFIPVFLKFASNLERNGWFYTNEISIYCRKSTRFLRHGRVETFDIASITVFPEGNGTFTNFLPQLEAWADVNDRALYIENVHNPRFAAFLSRRGYRRWPDAPFEAAPPSFYRLP